MLIVVEGPDGSGKSTLVKDYLSKCPTGPFVDMLGGRTADHAVMRKRAYGLPALVEAAKSKGVVCERHHAISDEIYRNVFGGPRAFSRGEVEDCMRFLASHGLVIYCRPPLEKVLEQKLLAKGDDDPEWMAKLQMGLPTLYRAYDRYMNHLSWRYRVPVVRCDYTDHFSLKDAEAILCAA